MVGKFMRRAAVIDTIKNAGESVRVRCVVIAPDLFSSVIKPGVEFELWDGGFFASGVVCERVDAGWPK